ncbi:MAG: hypothetical protein AAFN93_15775 [Bacteroidota bacterium]
MRNLFGLCLILLIVICFACPPPVSEPPVLSYEERGAILPEEATEELLFTWPDTILSGEPDEVVIELWQLDSFTQVGQHMNRYFLSPVFSAVAETSGQYALMSSDEFSLQAQTSYLWRVAGQDGEGSPVSSSGLRAFSVVDVDPLIAAQNSAHRGNADQDIQALAVPSGIYYDIRRKRGVYAAHTVNGRILFDKYALYSTTSAADTDDPLLCALAVDNGNDYDVKVYGRISIEVPVNKKDDIADKDPLYLYLFSTDTDRSNIGASFFYDVNGRTPDPQTLPIIDECQLPIKDTDYLPTVISNGTILAAVVTVDVDFKVKKSDQGTSDNYFFGAFLGAETKHVNGSVFTGHGQYQPGDGKGLTLTEFKTMAGNLKSHIFEHSLLLNIEICGE